MSEYAIKINELSKVYQLNIRLKLSVSDKLKNLFRPSKDAGLQIAALQNISFNVKKGEILGVIGDNGSGKSTLLKLISGITEPTTGSIEVNGRVASILEIGTGFHPELTGRENIYFGGSVLGLSQKEVSLILNDIIDFSELNNFIDVQVKYYSSGMFMRLAFALVVHVNADIILLDEIIAVGDIDFRKKCEDRIDALYKSGKTILFVSHELNSVIKMCSKFLVLKNGHIEKFSSNIDTIFDYLSKNNTTEGKKEKFELTDKNELENFKPIVALKTQEEAEEKLKDSKSTNISLIEITDFKNDYVGPKVSLRYYTVTNKKIDSTTEIFVECTYTQKTDLLILPNFELSYQLTTRLAALNPFYGDLKEPLTNFSSLGFKRVVCKIPKLFLNNGVFGVRLFFVNQKSEAIGLVEHPIYFTVGYSEEILNDFYYDGKFTGGLVPKLHWEINTK